MGENCWEKGVGFDGCEYYPGVKEWQVEFPPGDDAYFSVAFGLGAIILGLEWRCGLRILLFVLSCLWSVGCITPKPRPSFAQLERADRGQALGMEIGDRLSRQGQEISVCGQLYHVGAKVVLWNDAYGYDAYRLHRHFEKAEKGPKAKPERLARYDSYRNNMSDELRLSVERRGWMLEDLQEVLSQVVVHYDVAGSSQRCFEVLHDLRGLSCHFMLDLDGTIYQTLDLKERAWHAGVANDASVGIEIAHQGAYSDPKTLERWYVKSGGKNLLKRPKQRSGWPGLPEDFSAEPARREMISGRIHGRLYHQYDFTEAQYQSLEKLLTALVRIFPRVKPQVPRDGNGFFNGELPNNGKDFSGVLGHYHITKNKADPGPAFNWQRIEYTLERALNTKRIEN